MDTAPEHLATALVQLVSPVLEAASRANPAWLLVGLCLHSASLLCRVRIWHLLLRIALPGQAVSFGAALGPYLGAVAANVVAPFRGGDAVRLLLARRSLPEAGSVAVLATLAAEAIPGLIVVPLLLAVALALGVLPVSPGVAGAITVGGGALALAGWRLSGRIARRRGADGRVRTFVTDLARRVRLVGSPRLLARTVGPLVALDWLLRIGTITALLAAFHIGPYPAAATAVVAIDSLTTLLPVLPNGAGAQQAAVAGALHGHLSIAGLVAFSAAVQLLLGAADVLSGAFALPLLRSEHGPSQPAMAGGGAIG